MMLVTLNSAKVVGRPVYIVIEQHTPLPAEVVISVDEDVRYVGIICGTCRTESVFDLQRHQDLAYPIECPGCHTPLLERQHEGSYEFTWLDLLRKFVTTKKQHVFLFHIKKPVTKLSSAHTYGA